MTPMRWVSRALSIWICASRVKRSTCSGSTALAKSTSPVRSAVTRVIPSFITRIDGALKIPPHGLSIVICAIVELHPLAQVKDLDLELLPPPFNELSGHSARAKTRMTHG
jgi:hypothetical protein